MNAPGMDLRLAARALARRPVLTAVAVLTLALGLGANTAIFSLLEQVFVRQPPYPDPDRLVMLRLSEIAETAESGVAGAGLRGLRRADALSFLVAGEIALSLVLLIGAGLTLRSFAHLSTARLEIAGRPATGEPPAAGVHMVGPGHFRALRIPLLRGRTFTAADRAGSGRVAILNREAARRLFPGEDPLGRRLRLGIGWDEGETAEIVGIAGDVRYGTLEELPGPDVYIPFAQNSGDAFVDLIVRTRGAPSALWFPARRALAVEPREALQSE